MSTLVSIQLDSVDALAAELAALAAELAGDVAACAACAAGLASALDDDAGWHAAAAATSWARLVELLRARTAAVSGTLGAAVDGYRATEAALADSVRSVFPRAGAVPR